MQLLNKFNTLYNVVIMMACVVDSFPDTLPGSSFVADNKFLGTMAIMLLVVWNCHSYTEFPPLSFTL